LPPPCATGRVVRDMPPAPVHQLGREAATSSPEDLGYGCPGHDYALGILGASSRPLRGWPSQAGRIAPMAGISRGARAGGHRGRWAAGTLVVAGPGPAAGVPVGVGAVRTNAQHGPPIPSRATRNVGVLSLGASQLGLDRVVSTEERGPGDSDASYLAGPADLGASSTLKEGADGSPPKGRSIWKPWACGWVCQARCRPGVATARASAAVAGRAGSSPLGASRSQQVALASGRTGSTVPGSPAHPLLDPPPLSPFRGAPGRTRACSSPPVGCPRQSAGTVATTAAASPPGAPRPCQRTR